jgi:phosphoglycerate dehydrogenase-like enzyme
MTEDRPVHVVVAGVPRGYQNPDPDGRWLRAHHIEQIQAVSPMIRLVHTTRDELDQDRLPETGAEILLLEAGDDEWYRNEIPDAGFAKLVTPNLRWMQACSSGVSHILGTGLLDNDITLTNAAGVHADALGESTMAAVLLHAKQLRKRIENQHTRTWEELHCDELRGRTMTVLGTGNIGTAVARLASAFRMRLVGVRRNPRPADFFENVVGPDDLLNVLPQTDYLVIACPLTAETEGMIGAAELGAIKPGAYLINVSRGKVVQQEPLLAALRSGHLSGAFLDAHTEEPLPDDHPFWDAPGVTVIPHDSHSSPYIGDNIVDLFTDNLRRYLAGESMRNVIDRERGY